jgi:hypothetical protein
VSLRGGNGPSQRPASGTFTRPRSVLR